jgi:hypothetical protein
VRESAANFHQACMRIAKTIAFHDEIRPENLAVRVFGSTLVQGCATHEMAASR